MKWIYSKMKRQDRAMARSCGVGGGAGVGERCLSGGGRMMWKGLSRQSRVRSPAGGSWVSVNHPASKLCSHLFSGLQRWKWERQYREWRQLFV